MQTMAPPVPISGSTVDAEAVPRFEGEHLETRENFEQNQINFGIGIDHPSSGQRLKSFLWHGGSIYDAWFSAAAVQIGQALLTLPSSFAQLGTASGIILQIFYGLMGYWTCYLVVVLYCEYRSRQEKDGISFKNHVIQWFEILGGLLGPVWKIVGLIFNCGIYIFGSIIQLIACASNMYLINDQFDKRTWTLIFGACCFISLLVPTFHNFRVLSFSSLITITYTAWYVTIQSILVEISPVEDSRVAHSGPTSLVLYFTGATNILYTYGGHAISVEIMHAMDKPARFKSVYLFAILYVFTMTIPSATVAYRAFGDKLLTSSNVLALVPKTRWRDTAVVLMLIHQFMQFSCGALPLFFLWEKVLGVHWTNNFF